ncbi:glycine oxidase ThiO [Paenibacillus senegalensis]|uniref:glycine oxidase ThiO n=1 Tax=Paenibacillus senegalensis TaxID=1465766 RepID=UPI000288B82C|nr:glycine oxidase ThiO [Paenibacillus senegalensis]
MREQVIVLGGGVIGLAVAFELAGRGHEVTVLEANRCGGQASGAAAGMLAPYSENGEGPDDFFHLCRSSLALYPRWQHEVKLASGCTFEYTESGSLYVGYHEADELAMAERMAWQNEWGAEVSILSGQELREREPRIHPEARSALYCPVESHLYAPDYVVALEEGCRQRGVRIIDELGMLRVESWQNELVVSAGAGQRFEADRLVISTGAWSGQYAEAFGLNLPVYPIRGQICAYEQPTRAVHHMVFSSQGYVVAKDNGTLVSGASEDVAGFDTSVTEKGIERLIRWNKRLFPYLEDVQPFHRWAGLRPATQDGYPLIGKLKGARQVIWATGHYRNGILLSPVTAKLVADLIDESVEEDMLKAFAPERFT